MHHRASPSCWLLWNGSHSKTLLISQSFESFEAMMGVEVGLKCLVPFMWLEWKAPKRFPNLPESSENTDLEQCAPCSACCHNKFHKGKRPSLSNRCDYFPLFTQPFPELHILCIVENNLFMEYYCVGWLLDRQAFGCSFSKHHCYVTWPGTGDTKRPKI